MVALAFVLRTVQKSKFLFELQNPSTLIRQEERKLPKLVQAVKNNLKKKLEEVNLDLELSEVIKSYKIEILQNLMQEQNFRIPLTSTFNNQND